MENIHIAIEGNIRAYVLLLYVLCIFRLSQTTD